jgi:hypothetical protein
VTLQLRPRTARLREIAPIKTLNVGLRSLSPSNHAPAQGFLSAQQPIRCAHGSPLGRALAATSSALHHQSVLHPAAGSASLAPPEATPKSHHSPRLIDQSPYPLVTFHGHRIQPLLVARDQLPKHRGLIPILRPLPVEMNQGLSQQNTPCLLLLIFHAPRVRQPQPANQPWQRQTLKHQGRYNQAKREVDTFSRRASPANIATNTSSKQEYCLHALYASTTDYQPTNQIHPPQMSETRNMFYYLPAIRAQDSRILSLRVRCSRALTAPVKRGMQKTVIVQPKFQIPSKERETFTS